MKLPKITIEIDENEASEKIIAKISTANMPRDGEDFAFVLYVALEALTELSCQAAAEEIGYELMVDSEDSENRTLN